MKTFHWKDVVISFFVTLIFIISINVLFREEKSYIYQYKSPKEYYYFKFVNPEIQNQTLQKSKVNEYVENTPMNMEPLFPLITGPRKQALPKKNLVVLVVGIGSEGCVDNIITLFGFKYFTFILFIIHPISQMKELLKFGWFDNVISISYPNQLKWWYLKRFLTPVVVNHYEYIFIIDDDVKLSQESFDPLDYIKILKRFEIHLSQPAYLLGSLEPIHDIAYQKQRFLHGHKSDLIESSPVTVISSLMWRTCIWELIQEDLTSGQGLSLFWNNYCKQIYGFNSNSAIIDRYPMLHISIDSKPRKYLISKQENHLTFPKDEVKIYKKRFSNIIISSFNISSEGEDF